MVNIKKLGLTLIELEDQVLLIDESKKPKIKEWYLDRDGFIPKQVKELNGGLIYHHLDDWANLNFDRDCEIMGTIISSTKSHEGLALLIIDDEVEKLAEVAELEDTKDCDPFDEYYGGYDFNRGFQKGYNKAKEVHKYTEEDMIDFAMCMISQYKFGNTNIHNRNLLKESLPKKELYIEAEYKDLSGRWYDIPEILDMNNPEVQQMEFRPKITNNKIRVVWK